jgi:hypothetical protein
MIFSALASSKQLVIFVSQLPAFMDRQHRQQQCVFREYVQLK